ncbi:hypothetical protein HG535_0E04560 [Zygotorulaspora mrakii]|uniref:Enolase-phosphatase E1 n=1 Tax=Zygotorulaspora mrakii TaxID=42260 RepID=A0A7H9B6F0_ZYGMR|nr:uncharacterized protein HG535_0E04560 [Zygotorulaspora mrakii]QLG73372.1 hypothetical protein HG535_0E04560 [Zygotorulaspora mrakii]
MSLKETRKHRPERKTRRKAARAAWQRLKAKIAKAKKRKSDSCHRKAKRDDDWFVACDAEDPACDVMWRTVPYDVLARVARSAYVESSLSTAVMLWQVLRGKVRVTRALLLMAVSRRWTEREEVAGRINLASVLSVAQCVACWQRRAVLRDRRNGRRRVCPDERVWHPAGWAADVCVMVMDFKAVLLDIEGTVCPIAFVKEVLFPYFSEKVPQLVDSQDAAIVELLAQFHSEDVVSHIQQLVAADVKDPVLKSLQGLVWAQGYESGEIKSPVYKDAIELIIRRGNVYIYSSGSVKAQKLLFGHVQNPGECGTGTQQGGEAAALDLQPYISGYFDITTSGAKTDRQSYRNIVAAIPFEACEVLFISDNALELDAAIDAGLQTCLALRPGNARVQNISKYRSVEDFRKL